MQPMNTRFKALKLGFFVLFVWLKLKVSHPFGSGVGLVPTQDEELG